MLLAEGSTKKGKGRDVLGHLNPMEPFAGTCEGAMGAITAANPSQGRRQFEH